MTGRADLAAATEKALIEVGEELRRAGIAGRGAAAQPLQNFAILRAIGDAKAGRHDRRRDAFPNQGNRSARALIQWTWSCCRARSLATTSAIQSARACAERSVSNRTISRGGGETECRQSSDAQGEPKLQIKSGRWHGRTLLLRGCAQRRARRAT